mgnify:CR=1 FL=1
MIEWFTWGQVLVATAAGLLGVIAGLARRAPDDYTLGVTLLVEVLLVVPEFYVYLVSALLLPPLAGFWALVQRDRWSTVILGVTCLTIAVMVYRMNVIWFVQVA